MQPSWESIQERLELQGFHLPTLIVKKNDLGK
jgi:hypothetical protein